MILILRQKISRVLKLYFPGVHKFLRHMEYVIRHSHPIYRIQKTIRGMHHITYRQAGVLMSTEDLSNPRTWVIRDENWSEIADRREYAGVRMKYPTTYADSQHKMNTDVSFSKNSILRISARAETLDEWVYMFLDPGKYQWINYSWRFRVKRNTNFRELQFAFRYKNFRNRLRYRFEDSYIYFDKVVDFKFCNEFGKVPFQMLLGVWYDIRIDVFGNNYKCYVDNKLMMNDYDFSHLFENGPISIILWEDRGKPDIEAEIDKLIIYSLK